MIGPEITLVAVGDLLIRDDTPDYLFDSAKPVFHAADIVYGNCEQPYAWRYPGMAKTFRSTAGFDVMNFANNHILDHGVDVFHKTIQQLTEEGIAVFGAGRTIKEARAPAIIERSGTKVAFLGYCSIQVPSYAATVSRPGCAPLRAHTAYQEQFEEAPGSPPIIRTFASEDDLAAMLDDIRRAKEQAQVVVLSLHWGPLLKGAELSDFQPGVAHAAIDAGADIILGHHPHIIKGIEVYKGKVIFYSINHFVMKNDKALDINYESHGFVSNSHIRTMLKTYQGEFGFYPDYPLYPFGPDTLDTMIVKVAISDGRIIRVSYLPCRIGTDYQPIVLNRDHRLFDEITGHVARATRDAGLSAEFTACGDEIVVT